jgi:methylenetetrahydrofolate reductase (NADPH)
VPEMGNAVMRMSALGGAMILQSKGMETVMQVNCRDRNRIALQADLLSAYGAGIINVMGVSGEDPSLGDHHQSKAVHDIDLMTLFKAVKTLQSRKGSGRQRTVRFPHLSGGCQRECPCRGRRA